MRRNYSLPVLMAIGGVVLAGCGENPEPVAETPTRASLSTSVTTSATAASAPCGHNPTAPSSMLDDSVTNALERVGATDQMVCALGEVQDRAGYGMDTRASTFAERAGLATVIISDCEDAANGHITWSEIIADDVLDGAPLSGATMFNTHLEQVFCPALTLPEDPELVAVELTSASEDENGTRGLYSSIGWMDGRFEPVPLSECTSRIGSFLFDEQRAYKFENHSVLCNDTSNLTRPVWHPVVAFMEPQSEDAALTTARELLPVDAVEVDRVLGTSTIGAGTCLSVDYFSPKLAAAQQTAARQTKVRLPSDPGHANIHLYPERQTSNGSSAKYEGVAKVAYVSASRDNDDPDPAC